jgi:hypothetical protein
MSHLVPCMSCHRHVRVAEDRCPFCGAERAAELRAAAPPALPKRRLGRAALFTFGATLATASCDSTTTPGDGGAAGSTADGAAGTTGTAGTGAGGSGGAGSGGSTGQAGANGGSAGTAGATVTPAYGAPVPLYGAPAPHYGLPAAGTNGK